ncbi:uncharacterized protein DUF3499 [Brevibacterium sanguinis]|uniref:Uncharacterized protein DUF3499 n=3 Tax=Brevibacteriaceae TaxID=85019 RepID=A0A366IK52_9MICO|nr:uncharacterized protein DUF3499 [Brevibacterium sanguinis]RBP72792.1 uncharacterized protein DUF3499 [Brevibacterium celere]
MTYVHADACVVVGPLSRRAEPGAHDLCVDHAARLTPPVGWELIRIDGVGDTPPERTHDDLLAIADAVREAAGRPVGAPVERAEEPPAGRRHGHLRIIGEGPR